jgi:D-glucuronyl C5-epimerase-like protein
MSPHSGRFCVAAAVLVTLLAAAPSQASSVLRVDGSHTHRVNDPFVPSGPEGDLGTPPPAPPVAGASAKKKKGPTRGQKAVAKGLRTGLRKKSISRKNYKLYSALYRKARATRKRLKGQRGRELGSVIATIEAMALRRQFTAKRMPVLFLILKRNVQFWPRQPFPADRDHVSFRGSRLIYEYYRGQGIQVQPLVNFKQANNMHGACVKDTGEKCTKSGLKRLLSEMIKISSRRGKFRAWEYYFDFGGGRPPWVSGMATATGIQALGRASQLLHNRRYLKYAREAMPVFSTRPPTGVVTRGPLGGPHYLQYSFAPRLYIINAFMQSVIGLYDYAKITGDATAARLWTAAEPEVERELPRNDLGDWTTYSYGGNESTRDYHELLREFAASLCSRLHKKVYCDAARRFRSYMTDPAELDFLGPDTATKGVKTRVRFEVSKLSAVQVVITTQSKTSLNRTATFRRGAGSFEWRPGATGTYTVRLVAKELRTGQGLRTRTSGEIESAAP